MANLSIRKLTEEAYEQLRLRALRHSVSMEEEVRQIIYQAVSAPQSISKIFRLHFGRKNGVDCLDTRSLHKPHNPLDFDE